MHLTGKQVQQICDALLDGYSTKDELRMLVRVKLNQNLETIVGGDNMRVIVFNLVAWAEQTDRVDDLIQGACDLNPGNTALHQLGQEWRAALVSQAAVQSVAAPTPNPPVGRVSIDLFLSYSRKDRDAMHLVFDALHTAGLSVWTDEGLEPGTQSWQEAITEALSQAKAMVVLLSPNANASIWVKREIGFAQARGKGVFPLLISGDDASSVPINLIDVQRVDGRKNLDAAIDHVLLPGLRRHLMLGHIHPTPPINAVTAGGTLDSSAKKGQISSSTPRKKTYFWYLAAIIVGAVGLYAAERLLFPTQPSGPTSTANAARATHASATVVLPTVAPTQLSPLSPLAPTATLTPEPTATWPPAPKAGTTKTNPSDGAEYVYVPAGPFKMGSVEGSTRVYVAEKPQTTVNVAGFWIMRTEVTNEQYRRCVDASACTEPKNRHWLDRLYADHPVTDVDWHQAQDYAQWAGGRLPTESEWEKACRGTDARTYPWGESAPREEMANFDGNVGDTTPVGWYTPLGFPPYGLADMAGNVWEWTSSQYRAYPYSATDGRENPDGDANRTVRGGSWNYFDRAVRCAYRDYLNPKYGVNDTGFRIVFPVN